jgi:peptidyl-prolyl cis-trans isomerase C
LKDGGDFAALAKEKSTGPSGPNGGDLGWFQAASMVPEFAAALKGMKKGESSQSPVKTQFGWHVIKLEDSRKKEAPTFEASKDRLKTIVANKAVQDYLKSLRESAKIDIKEGAAGNGAPH